MRQSSERGAMLVQVAVMLVALLGFCAFVVDYGAFWVARAQAQNAADAGALAGATALAFDSIDPVRAVESQRAAEDTARANAVWSQQPGATALVAQLSTEPNCRVPNPWPRPVARTSSCVTVTVTTAAPVFFGRMFGLTEQTVRAQARGTASQANSSACVWPLALPDRWTEPGGWAPSSQFTPGDMYTAPTATQPGSGHALNLQTLSADVAGNGNTPPGAFVLTAANYAQPISGNQFVSVALPGGAFSANLTSCNGVSVFINDNHVTSLAPTPQLFDDAKAAATARIAADSGARWDSAALRIRGGCAGIPPCPAVSPRLVALPLFDVARYEATRGGGNPEIHVVNFVGFFLSAVKGPAGVACGANEVCGNFTTYPGDIVLDKPTVAYQAGFLRTGLLNR